ncbi:MAG: ACT domain-containing protein [Synergistaceae bacterium]|nr:ACT domain-containing protein [Synergistaceae bacterium]
MSSLIVSRFGGIEAADSQEVKKSAEIIKSNPSRRYIVVSAPGSAPGKIGITDMLYICHSRFQSREKYDDILGQISERYKEIVSGTGIEFDVDTEIVALKRSLEFGMNLDYIASRGEYIMAKIFARLLDWPFVDASEIIFFNKDGTPDIEKTSAVMRDALSGIERAVIPGFYGSLPDGKIKTFRRGDCDSAGSIVACSVKADLFEKWSETSKIYSADPAVIPDAEVVSHITYNEALELNYLGIDIVTDNVVLMLGEAGIPMRICSTNRPEDEGMLISPKLPEGVSRSMAACISGRKAFTIVSIKKYGLNTTSGFGEKLFGIFARNNIACQHYLSGIHKMAFVLKNPMFDLRRVQILKDIERALEPLSVTVEKGLSLIAVIGEGIGAVIGTFSRILSALSEAGINVRMIDQGSDDLNIIIGVADSDYEAAVKALYNAVGKGNNSLAAY